MNVLCWEITEPLDSTEGKAPRPPYMFTLPRSPRGEKRRAWPLFPYWHIFLSTSSPGVKWAGWSSFIYIIHINKQALLCTCLEYYKKILSRDNKQALPVSTKFDSTTLVPGKFTECTWTWRTIHDDARKHEIRSISESLEDLRPCGQRRNHVGEFPQKINCNKLTEWKLEQ